MAVTKEQIEAIEQETKDQSESDTWMKERAKRCTASRVGGLAKMKKTTKRSKKVEEIVYSKFKGNWATQHGKNAGHS